MNKEVEEVLTAEKIEEEEAKLIAIERLNHFYELVGERAVLLPLRRGVKGPDWKDWQNTTFERTQRIGYQHRLKVASIGSGNLGVLLGSVSGDLCTIDIDTDAEIDAFLQANPKLASSLRTRGANGCQIWVRVVGKYPERRIASKLKVPGIKKNKSVAEWRGGGGHQSIIHGKHPDRDPDKKEIFYRFLVEAPAIEIAFDEIKWPEHWEMIFDGEKKTAAPGAKADTNAAGPSAKAAEALPPKLVSRIWRYIEKVDLAVEGEGGSNPTYRLANVLVWDFALSKAQAKPFMLVYSLRCEPPWTEKEIDHKIDNAMKADHGGKPRGHLLGEKERSRAAAKPDPEYSAQEILKALGDAAIKGSAFRELKIPSREKLLDDWFREGDTGFIYSHRGVGKTWLAWRIARAIASGEDAGPWQAGEKSVPVCYVDGEMPPS